MSDAFEFVLDDASVRRVVPRGRLSRATNIGGRLRAQRQGKAPQSSLGA